MRVVQKPGQRGSLKWIQQAIGSFPEIVQPTSLPTIKWLSPLKNDDFAEYRDDAFLNLVGLSRLSSALAEFWPKRGPQWDALGVTEQGPILVEAKAHLREFISPASQAGDASLARIKAAFLSVQEDLGIDPAMDWSKAYFQYANRLAILWWLRRQGIDAKLLFVSFLNDFDIGGPASAETWHASFATASSALGLPSQHKLAPHIYHVTPDVRLITAASRG